VIHIIDYGLGNVQAFLNVYKRMGFKALRAKTVDDLSNATKIILPGVGAFDHAIELLNQSGMRDKLDDLAINNKIPILGVCVGMQILASSSDEGNLPGLGWIPGKVCSFNLNPKTENLPLPHMGWNNAYPNSSNPLFKGLEDKAKFYFLHSYYFKCNNDLHQTSKAFYGFDFSCSISKDNIFGVQFHPEKSHHFGAQLLKNFAEV
jgi:imidazole glycerol-phosphate synthase subunit HisH